MHRTIFENDLQIAPILIGTDLHTNNVPRVTPGATRVEADRPLAFQGLALITLTQPAAIATAPTSYTCSVEPEYNLNGAFGVNVIPSIRARPST